MAEKHDSDGDVVTKTRTEKKTARPKLYKVLVHNDDYTTREFVVDVLMTVFHRTESEATAIMLHVHNNGVGVAGVYTRDVAETKVDTVHRLARQYEYPLRLSAEPED